MIVPEAFNVAVQVTDPTGKTVQAKFSALDPEVSEQAGSAPKYDAATGSDL